jgi:hypothetical protein
VSRPQGLRACCPKPPEWGLGHVLADDGGAKVTVFFRGGETRTLDTTNAELDLVTGLAAEERLRELRKAYHAARFAKQCGKAFSLGFATWR